MSKYGEPWQVVEVMHEYCKEQMLADRDGGHLLDVLGASMEYPSLAQVSHPERIVACVNALDGLNPAGIPFLISEVRKVTTAMRDALGTYHDPTNILPTLETALRAVEVSDAD